MSTEVGQEESDMFQDKVGRNVVDVFQNLENGLDKLIQNLENQFEDTNDEENPSLHSSPTNKDILTQKIVKNEMIINKTEEGVDEIIDLLNSEQSSDVDTEGIDEEDENDDEDEDDENNDFEEVSTGSPTDGQRDSNSLYPPSGYRIFELIDALLSRPDYEEDDYDEWEHDDDTGYINISLANEEFFSYEERNAEVLYNNKNNLQERPNKQDVSSISIQGAFRSDLINEIVNSETSRSKTDSLQSSIDQTQLNDNHYQFMHDDVVSSKPNDKSQRRQSISEQRRSEIMGQHRFQGADGETHSFFQLKVIFEPFRTGFEEQKDFQPPKGTIIAGRYEVYDILGQAAFSTALQCYDLGADEDKQDSNWVCLKVIKNNKDFFDQSLDEIKLLQYINSHGDADMHHVLRLIDFFYYKEHLFIVSELLKENLYEFGRYITENQLEVYYTLPRLKRITKQIIEALKFIHQLKLIHCDVKPENIVIKSFSRCEVKLIDFGSSCFSTDHLTTYIQSRSYRAPEVILGHKYDSRIDIWSVGAVLAELYTGYVLFQNDSVPTMLSRITGILGAFPAEVLAKSREANKYFTLNSIVYEKDASDASGSQFHLIFPKKTNLRKRLHLDPLTMQQRHMSPTVRTVSSASTGETFETTDEELFVDFIRQLLNLNPENRYTAKQALCHPWLADADTVQFQEYVIGQPAIPIPPPEPMHGVPTSMDESLLSNTSQYYTGYDEVENMDMALQDHDDSDETEIEGETMTLEEELALFEAEQRAALSRLNISSENDGNDSEEEG